VCHGRSSREWTKINAGRVSASTGQRWRAGMSSS
jgi:hypothetical protein